MGRGARQRRDREQHVGEHYDPAQAKAMWHEAGSELVSFWGWQLSKLPRIQVQACYHISSSGEAELGSEGHCSDSSTATGSAACCNAAQGRSGTSWTAAAASTSRSTTSTSQCSKTTGFCFHLSQEVWVRCSLSLEAGGPQDGVDDDTESSSSDAPVPATEPL